MYEYFSIITTLTDDEQENQRIELMKKVLFSILRHKDLTKWQCGPYYFAAKALENEKKQMLVLVELF